MIWPDFIPVEMRGMSIVSALCVTGICIALLYLQRRICAMESCIHEVKKTLVDLRVTMKKIETWSHAHHEDIQEIREILRERK